MDEQTPRPRLRRLIGSIALIAGLTLYALLVARLADALAPMHPMAELAFYAVFGLVWILPVRSLLTWMRGPAQ